MMDKTNQLIILGVAALFIAVTSLSIVVFIAHSPKKEAVNQTAVMITPLPKMPSPAAAVSEKIISAGMGINCQAFVATSQKKIYLSKFDSCGKLRYVVSSTGKYLTYIYTNNNKNKLFVFSLENNAESLLDNQYLSVIDFKFTKDDNLVVLAGNNILSYFLVPGLFSGYPANYDLPSLTFSDLVKKRTDVNLPLFSSQYAKISEESGKINLLDKKNTIIYTLLLQDLYNQIIPPEKQNQRLNYDWQKRLVYIDGDQFKSVNSDGDIVETHNIVCGGKSIKPADIIDGIAARSPDGKSLVMVLSTGKIIFVDLATDECDNTDLTQTHYFKENISISPNGQYLAYVNQGLRVFDINKKTDNKVLAYSPQNIENPYMVSGPLEWSSDSRFVCLALSKVTGDGMITPYSQVSTQMIRAYFDDNFQGNAEEIINFPNNNTPYACSADGDAIVYQNGYSIYKYSISGQQNSLFKTLTGDTGFKFVWLKSDEIVSNKWIYEQTGKFTDIILGADFSVSIDGTTAAYTDNGKIIFFNLETKEVIPNKNDQEIKGKVLIF